MNPFSTHLPILKRAIEITDGPVLEIGCGYGSTPILHEMCKNRMLYTLEINSEWVKKFMEFNSDTHKVLTGDTYDIFDELIRGTAWDVVLVDHAPAERRNVEIEKLHHAKYVVVHDTEDPVYKYELTFPSYKFKYLYLKNNPRTTVLSDIQELSQFLSV